MPAQLHPASTPTTPDTSPAPGVGETSRQSAHHPLPPRCRLSHAFGPVEPPPPRRGQPLLTRRQRMTRRLVTWYVRRELPRYGSVLNAWGINRQQDWARAPVVEIRDRFHGQWMRLDLSDFFQRIAYFFGCYHELDVFSALTAALRPGDVFVDGGANIGLLSMHASSIVGPAGEVHSFEPNPAAARRLRWHVARNLIRNLRCYEGGLSDEGGTLELRVPGSANLAAGTLGPIPDRYHGEISQRESVVVIPGDDLLPEDDARPLFIKLDVEGFELKALRGLMRTIRSRRPAVLTEVNGEMLGANGSSPREVYDTLAPLGYELFALDRRGFRKRHRLMLHPLSREQIDLEKDVLFLHREGPHWPRLRAAMMPPGRYWRHLCPPTT